MPKRPDTDAVTMVCASAPNTHIALKVIMLTAMITANLSSIIISLCSGESEHGNEMHRVLSYGIRTHAYPVA